MSDEKKRTEEVSAEQRKQPVKQVEEEYDEYAGYTRENPPPWLDEFEYIDFMMTH